MVIPWNIGICDLCYNKIIVLVICSIMRLLHMLLSRTAVYFLCLFLFFIVLRLHWALKLLEILTNHFTHSKVCAHFVFCQLVYLLQLSAAGFLKTFVDLQCLPSVLWRCWLGSRKGIRPVKNEWLGAGMVICLERDADSYVAQLMPLPLTVSCFSKIQIGFTFLVPAHLGSPGKGPLNGCVCVSLIYILCQCCCWCW